MQRYSLLGIHPKILSSAYTCISVKECCISFLSSIRPQLPWPSVARWSVIPLPFSTSSHNAQAEQINIEKLYLFPFLHQTTTCTPSSIKPTAKIHNKSNMSVISLPFSTSDHNFYSYHAGKYWLYLFPFLHQTTTR